MEQNKPGTEADEKGLCPFNIRKSRSTSIRAEYSRRYYIKNREKIAKYRERTAEQRREYMRQYRQRKKEQNNETLQG